MLIDAAHREETRVAVLKDGQLFDFDYEGAAKKPIKGNIYLAKIVRIEPSLQAAFVEYGGNRHGFLAFTEIHPDYFRIPVAMRPEEEPQPADEESPVSEETAEPTDEEATVEAADVPFHKENPYRSYKIQEVLKNRQILLVQVVKEERGNKGAALTTFVSLAGRYCVLMPNALNSGGVSRRITDMEDRKRLKEIISDLDMPEGMSLIVRTAGYDGKKTEIKKDYQYLSKLWSEIREKTLQANAPSLVHEEGDLVRRSIRDLYGNDVEEIWVEGEEAYKSAKEFIKDLVPSHAKKVNLYKDASLPLFYKYKIEQQIDQMHETKVKMPSGGYLVINQTEALVAIDVNSGKSTRERHIDSTALKTNLEAASEAARQIRLRDLAGLVVIDFIDMSEPKHNHAVERKLKEALAEDRARLQVGRISQFGLLEMSRQRLRPSITESTSIPCIYCQGKGLMRSKESISLQLLRALEEALIQNPQHDLLNVYVPASIAFYLLSEKRAHLSDIEKTFKTVIKIFQDEQLNGTLFRLENADGGNLLAPPADAVSEGPSGEFKKSKRRRGNKGGNGPSAQAPKTAEAPAEGSAPTSETEPAEEHATEPTQSGQPSEGGDRRDHNRNRNRRRFRNNRDGRQRPHGGNPPSDGQPRKERPEGNEPNGNVVRDPNQASPDIDDNIGNTVGHLEDDLPTTAKKPRGPGRGRESGWWKRLLDN